MEFRLNDLENFVAVSSCRTLSEGAQKRGISQPALSESVRRLESDLGCMLFYRSRTGISLTPSGRLILDRGKHATEVLIELETFKAKGQFQGRSVTIGCHHVVASYRLPQALSVLSKSAPDFRVNLMHGSSRVVQAQVQSGSIDIGIIVNPTRNPDLVIKKILTDTFAVWERKRGATQNRVICDPDLFQTQAILRKWKSSPRDLISSTNLELIARLTDAGVGYGLIPKGAVDLVGVDLRRVPGAPSCTDLIAVVHRPEFGKLPYERKVIEALLGAVA